MDEKYSACAVCGEIDCVCGLLPCPFCGSEKIDAEYIFGSDNTGNYYQAGCRECEAIGPSARTPQNAKTLWNKRG